MCPKRAPRRKNCPIPFATRIFYKFACFAFRRSQTAQGAPETAPRRPKKPPRGTQDSPGGPQDGPRGAHDGPRGPHDEPKRGPRGGLRTESSTLPPQEAARRPQEAPKKPQGGPPKWPQETPKRPKRGPKGPCLLLSLPPPGFPCLLHLWRCSQTSDVMIFSMRRPRALGRLAWGRLVIWEVREHGE